MSNSQFQYEIDLVGLSLKGFPPQTGEIVRHRSGKTGPIRSIRYGLDGLPESVMISVGGDNMCSHASRFMAQDPSPQLSVGIEESLLLDSLNGMQLARLQDGRHIWLSATRFAESQA